MGGGGGRAIWAGLLTGNATGGEGRVAAWTSFGIRTPGLVGTAGIRGVPGLPTAAMGGLVGAIGIRGVPGLPTAAMGGLVTRGGLVTLGGLVTRGGLVMRGGLVTGDTVGSGGTVSSQPPSPKSATASSSVSGVESMASTSGGAVGTRGSNVGSIEISGSVTTAEGTGVQVSTSAGCAESHMLSGSGVGIGVVSGTYVAAAESGARAPGPPGRCRRPAPTRARPGTPCARTRRPDSAIISSVSCGADVVA